MTAGPMQPQRQRTGSYQKKREKHQHHAVFQREKKNGPDYAPLEKDSSCMAFLSIKGGYPTKDTKTPGGGRGAKGKRGGGGDG